MLSALSLSTLKGLLRHSDCPFVLLPKQPTENPISPHAASEHYFGSEAKHRIDATLSTHSDILPTLGLWVNLTPVEELAQNGNFHAKLAQRHISRPA